jgi:hypothetical protein
VAAYQANYKFKVANQEREMDEWIRSAIKDPETEAKVRELYEKAYGLDVVKPRLHEYRDKYRALETEHGGLQTEVQEVMGLRDKDLGKFFNRTGVSKEKIFQWVMNELNYENLPQDQRQIMDRERAASERAEQLEQQFQRSQEFAQQQAVHARTVELQMVRSQPEVKTFQERFDSIKGPGAFENEVLAFGRNVFRDSGTDLSAMQAVKAVMDHYTKFLGAMSPASTPGAETQPVQQAPQNQATPAAPQKTSKPPVIPVVNGKSSQAATEIVPKSVDDLKRIYNEKYGRKSS